MTNLILIVFFVLSALLQSVQASPLTAELSVGPASSSLSNEYMAIHAQGEHYQSDNVIKFDTLFRVGADYQFQVFESSKPLVNNRFTASACAGQYWIMACILHESNGMAGVESFSSNAAGFELKHKGFHFNYALPIGAQPWVKYANGPSHRYYDFKGVEVRYQKDFGDIFLSSGMRTGSSKTFRNITGTVSIGLKAGTNSDWVLKYSDGYSDLMNAYHQHDRELKITYTMRTR